MPYKTFTGVREKWLPLYEQLRETAIAALGPFEERETSAAIQWKHSTTFAEVSAKKDALTIGLPSNEPHEEWKPARLLKISKNRVAHYFEVTEEGELLPLVDRIALAYELTRTSRAPVRAPATSYATVDEYIESFPPGLACVLRDIRRAINTAAPEAAEKISWQMPTFYYRENLVHFAAAKHHVGFFPSPEAIEAFAGRLAGYKTTKGGIQFPLSEGMPLELISDITRWRVARVNEKYR
ncbi:MAG: DUF5655 domain-containing protein [Oscillospiraceae bacterium]|jgi:uncharacterized protein YdhG (YjbR/CyaY superfamily)|nr:DUF5655 domain-containing protein [Oscillospiraceae bacterium]